MPSSVAPIGLKRARRMVSFGSMVESLTILMGIDLARSPGLKTIGEGCGKEKSFDEAVPPMTLKSTVTGAAEVTLSDTLTPGELLSSALEELKVKPTAGTLLLKSSSTISTEAWFGTPTL